MKTKLFLALAALLCLVGFTYQTRPPVRWEYTVAPAADDAGEDRTLKALGGGGWELVTVRAEASGSGRVLYFKRAR